VTCVNKEALLLSIVFLESGSQWVAQRFFLHCKAFSGHFHCV